MLVVVLDLGILWYYLEKEGPVGVLPSVVVGETVVVPLGWTTVLVPEKVKQSELLFQMSAWV